LSDIIKNIVEIVENNFPDDSYFLVDIIVKGPEGNKKVVILIDRDNGIDIETCSSISRIVSENLDALDLFKEKYILEVSSPGVDFPLKSTRQYRKNIGRKIKILLNDNLSYTGELKQVDEKGICISKENENQKHSTIDTFISFKDIKKTKVLVTFK